MFNHFFTGFDLAFILTMVVIIITFIAGYKLGDWNGYDRCIEDVEEGKIDIRVRNHRMRRNRS
jgi:hypothetical protein